jgi:hypothetical protein
MRLPNLHASTHSDHLERWLGADAVAHLSASMRGWYGPPIAVAGVPGNVMVCGDGDFHGRIFAGSEVSALERANEILQNMAKLRFLKQAAARKQLGAFGSMSALIAAATGGKGQRMFFAKTGVAANAIGSSNDLWTAVGHPAAGAAGGAAPGGTPTTMVTTGALQGFQNGVAGANLNHFVSGYADASVAANQLLLYDRTFSVAKTMNSTAVQAVTGVPTRYQSTVANAPDFCGGTFVTISDPTTILAATAHNWTVCTYSNQTNANTPFPSIAGVSACVVGGVDLNPAISWFMPLAAGDYGVLNLKQMQCSALVATGTIDFVIGHPIAIFPCPIASMACFVDGIGTAFNLINVMDNACLAFLELTKPSTTLCSYNGMVQLVSE